MGEAMNVQGWRVLDPKFLKILKNPGAVYVRLPLELQRPTGGCSCDYCKQAKVGNPEYVPMWDTLGVPLEPGKRTWTLHAPEWK